MKNSTPLQTAPPSGKPAGAGRRAKRIALSVVAAVVLLPVAIIAILLVDANILRAPIAKYVSQKIDRSFVINGDLRIRLFKHPRVEMNDVVLGNAPWGSAPAMVQVERAVIGVELLPLLQGRIVLPEVDLTKPDVLLERNADGGANWTFDKIAKSQSIGPSRRPEFRSLWIKDGKLAFRDPVAQTHVRLEITSDRPAGDTESLIRFSGEGSVRNEAFHVEGRAGSLLALMESGEPYRLDVKASAGGTKASFVGTLVPLKLETIDGDLEVSGKDLSELYPIVPVPMPRTAAYRVSGHVVREGQRFSMHGLKGRVGRSDVEGKASIDLSAKRPLLTADITSRRLDYKDLAGFLGASPPGDSKPEAEAKEQGRAAQEQKAQREDTGRVLPSKPYSLERLRVVDADVRFKGKSIVAPEIPLDTVAFVLKLRDGKLVMAPLDFGVAGGHVSSHITLDARRDVIQTQADATVKNLEVKALLPKLKEGQGSAGKLGGRAKLTTKGNSIAQMAASANGEIALIMSHGRASTLVLVLTNLDLANATKYLLRGDSNAPVYCAVVHASAREGQLVPDIFVVDTSEENITGEGAIDFKDEQYKLRLVAHSKRASLIALRGPIRIAGTFKDPQIRPEIGPLVARVGAAVALGVFLTPVASLLALVDSGGAKDSNCAALIDRASKEIANTAVAPATNPTPAQRPAETPSTAEKARKSRG